MTTNPLSVAELRRVWNKAWQEACPKTQDATVEAWKAVIAFIESPTPVKADAEREERVWPTWWVLVDKAYPGPVWCPLSAPGLEGKRFLKVEARWPEYVDSLPVMREEVMPSEPDNERSEAGRPVHVAQPPQDDDDPTAFIDEVLDGVFGPVAAPPPEDRGELPPIDASAYTPEVISGLQKRALSPQETLPPPTGEEVEGVELDEQIGKAVYAVRRAEEEEAGHGAYDHLGYEPLVASPSEDRVEVVWHDPLCTKPGFVANAVSRATPGAIITAMKGNFPERNYTDQAALDDFMVVHWAWLENLPLPSNTGEDDQHDIEAAEEALADFNRNGGVTLDELKAELTDPPSEDRGEYVVGEFSSENLDKNLTLPTPEQVAKWRSDFYTGKMPLPSNTGEEYTRPLAYLDGSNARLDVKVRELKGKIVRAFGDEIDRIITVTDAVSGDLDGSGIAATLIRLPVFEELLGAIEGQEKLHRRLDAYKKHHVETSIAKTSNTGEVDGVVEHLCNVAKAMDLAPGVPSTSDGPLLRQAASLLSSIKEEKENFRAAASELSTEVTGLDKQLTAAKAKNKALREAANGVCDFDWSDNDEDAVEAIERLRRALGGA